MAKYLKIKNTTSNQDEDTSNQDENGILLIEIDEVGPLLPGGIGEASLGEAIGGAIAKSVAAPETLFGKAVSHAIRTNARAFLEAIRSLPEKDQPAAMEVTFGLEATCEIGNAAITKGTGKANYTVKLNWQR